MQNAAKKYIMKANLLENEDVNFKNKVKDLKIKDKDDIDISTAYSYLHAVIITYKY